MNTISHIAILILITLGYASADQCSAAISVNARAGGSWTSNGVSYQMYDITVSNTGACSISTLYGFFGYPSTASIAQEWNYDSSSGQITGFGNSLAPGATSTSAGFTLSGTGTPSLAFNRPTCPCSSAPTASPAPTSKPATHAPTSKPATPAPTSKPATPAPTSKPVTPAPTSKPATPAPTSTPTTAPTDAPSIENCNNTCTSDEVCVALNGPIPTCQPRSCSALHCSENQVCIDDGGVARCITTSEHESRNVAINDDDCNNQCTADEVCVALDGPTPTCQPRSCSALQCQANSQICIDDGGVARCITPHSPAATSTPTSSPASSSPCESLASVSISVVARANGASSQNDVPSQIWDFIITNEANVQISDLVISITSSSQVTQMWNIVNTESNQYSVSTYGQLSGQGATYYAAGIVITGASSGVAPSVATVSFTCA